MTGQENYLNLLNMLQRGVIQELEEYRKVCLSILSRPSVIIPSEEKRALDILSDRIKMLADFIPQYPKPAEFYDCQK